MTKTYRFTLPNGTEGEFTSKAKRTFTHGICREVAGEWALISKTGGDPSKMRAKEIQDRPVGYDDGYHGVWGPVAVVELTMEES